MLCIPRAMCNGGNCMEQGSYTCTHMHTCTKYIHNICTLIYAWKYEQYIHIGTHIHAYIFSAHPLCAESLLKFSVFTFDFSYLVMSIIAFSPGNLHIQRFENGNKADLMWMIKWLLRSSRCGVWGREKHTHMIVHSGLQNFSLSQYDSLRLCQQAGP